LFATSFLAISYPCLLLSLVLGEGTFLDIFFEVASTAGTDLTNWEDRSDWSRSEPLLAVVLGQASTKCPFSLHL
jgi:hypothetical protein